MAASGILGLLGAAGGVVVVPSASSSLGSTLVRVLARSSALNNTLASFTHYRKLEPCVLKGANIKACIFVLVKDVFVDMTSILVLVLFSIITGHVVKFYILIADLVVWIIRMIRLNGEKKTELNILIYLYIYVAYI